MINRLVLLVHVTSAILLLSTFTTAWLAYARALRAVRERDAAALAALFELLNAADRWLTPASSVLLIASGAYASKLSGLSITRTGWIIWSLIALGLSGIVFLARLRGLQSRLEREARHPATDWRTAGQLLASWAAWAGVGTTLVGGALGIMLLRPVLPAF